VKLIVPEPESAAMRRALVGWERTVSSEVVTVEARRAAGRVGGPAPERAEKALEGLILIPLSPMIRDAAASMSPPALRSLDAIHLATARALGPELGILFVYDHRLAAAAAEAAMPLASPA